MRFATVVILLGFWVDAAAAQQPYRRHNFTFGMGAGQPRGDLRNLYSDSFGLGVSYGFRFHPYFQADIGFDTLFGAAGVRDFVPTAFGDLRIRDYQHFLPMGGRVIVPFANEKVHFYAGGGGTYMRYTERIRQPFSDGGFRFDCSVCTARDGWGYYATAGANLALDRYRHWRLGAGSKVIRGHTDGEPLGAVGAVRTNDRWINVFGELTFSF